MDFKQKLKAVYKRHDKIAPLIEGLEGEIPQQTLDDYYVKLKTIIKEDDDKKQGNYETISGQKKEVEIENIFDQPLIRRLLILGGAGVGKSTLMQYMAYRWSTSGLWSDKFDYVYRVTLKTLLNAGWDRDYDKTQRQDELKCLIHYNLVAQGEESCKLEDIPWLEKKNKILLLLDGYDEVAHERNGLYKKLFEKIFEHENIILTSRPNAIDKQMAEKFGKKIENTGLDYEGINKYLSQYFRNDEEKGEALREFLDKNSSIKEICHIPVNIAMMCFIWSEGDSNEALREISNMSDLYKQVVDHLGFRYFAKTNIQQNQDELMSKWKGGEIYLDELQVLEHTAYKGMTGGGIQVPEEKRSETLIIKGMNKKGDKDGISIQSSINYLRDQLKKDMPTINKVYKYGLLKPEGVVIDSKKNPKKELSETDLQEQSFSFIHLSFQEFLTALYFVQHLVKENNKEEQERIANFIAQHRNEPRYLMTLKLMAGILSANEEHADQGIKIFWDAVLCNPDGVLELGVEAKVTLLMHLLGQAKKEDQVDKRIPNYQVAVDLIDSVVLQDLAKWGPQLKESDYVSENIKEGIIQYLIKDNKNWMGETSCKLQEKFTKQIKKANNNVTIEGVLEIAESLINKFSEDQQSQILNKVVKMMKDHTETQWKFTKKAIETFFTMHQKTKLDLDDNKKKELLDAFLVTADDSNLIQLSFKGLQEILNVKKNGSFIEIIKTNLKQEKEDLKAENVIGTKVKLLTLAVNPQDIQFRAEVIKKSFAPYLQNSIRDVRILASNTITGIAIETSGDNQFTLEVMNLLLPSIKDSEINESVSGNIRKLMDKIGNDEAQKFIRDHVKALTPSLIENPDQTEKVIATATGINQLIKINIGNIDVELASDFINSLVKVMETAYDFHKIKKPMIKQIKDLVQICKNNPQLAKSFIKILMSLYKKEKHDYTEIASGTIIEIMQLIDKSDVQFVKDIIGMMTPLLGGADMGESWAATFLIINIVKKVNGEFGKNAIEIFSPFLSNLDEGIRVHFGRGIQDIVENDDKLLKDAINKMVPLLNHSEKEIKRFGLYEIKETIEKCRKADPQFIADIIEKTYLPILQDPKSEIKETAVFNIGRLMNRLKTDDQVPLIKKIVQAFIPLLQDSSSEMKKTVSDNLSEMIETRKDNKEVFSLKGDVIKALIPLLKDSDSNVKIYVSYSITKFFQMDFNSDTKSRREILNELAPLLQDPDEKVKSEVSRSIVDGLVGYHDDSEFAKDVVNLLAPFLQSSNSKDLREMTLRNLSQISERHKKLIRDILDLLTPFLEDSHKGFKSYNCSVISQLAKNNSYRDDPQLTKDIIGILSPLLKGDELRIKKDLVESLARLTSYTRDEQMNREIINVISVCLQDADGSLREWTCKYIMEGVKTIKTTADNQFRRSILEMFTPLLKDSKYEVKKLVAAQVVELMQPADKSDTQLVKDAYDLMISLVSDYHGSVRMDAPKNIEAFINKISPQFARNAIEALIPNLKETGHTRISTAECIANIIKNEKKEDVAFIKETINAISPLLKEEGDYIRNSISGPLAEMVIFSGNAEIAKDTVKIFIPLLQDPKASVRDTTRGHIKKIIQQVGQSSEMINILTPLLKDSNLEVRKSTGITLMEIVKINEETKVNRGTVIKLLIPLLKDSEKDVRSAALKNITELVKISSGDLQLVKQAIENFVPLLQDVDNQTRIQASSNIRELLAVSNDDQIVKDTISIVSPLLQNSNSDISKNAFELLKNFFPKMILNPDSFEKYLTHSAENVRDSVTSYLLNCAEKYLNRFQEFELIFQRPISDITLEMIMEKLFNGEKKNESLQEKIKNCLEKSKEESEKLKLFLATEINEVEELKGAGIIELAIVSIGQEKASTEDSDRKKLVESAKEVLNIQLKYLNEEGLVWINKNCEKLLALSAEAKVFYKKVYHKLLEDGQISSLEEELLIKFINQGLTTSLTRGGEIIFEGKRYKLKGEDIEIALEKIAKTVIEQQQDILAMQYKQHEPIFKISGVKGGMKQAASDIKEIRSIVDSRHALKIDSWLLTKLKSLKFHSEIFFLEQRSAFGDHVIYHFGQQKLIRFYAGETPVLQEIFGSYIYGEAYQGEVTELADKVGERLFESKGDIKPTTISVDGKLKSKQIYFQQELLKQGNEDRNSAVEEELAKKLDNNRAVLQSKLKSLKLQDSERSIIEDYYEGFISTFSSVYTSSQAIDSGKLSIDDGEDFFSPVNLFIQLSSLAPFGIGEVLSGGLEAVRSHIKSTAISNEAKFVKDFAIDAVELSDLVSKIAINIISNKEQRKKILEAKDEEEPNNLVNKVKNLVMEKIEKLKSLAEKYTKMKNLFEKEVGTSPAFRLGESDANKIIKEWINLKQSQSDLRMKPDEKLKKFVRFTLGENAEIIDVNKITPMPTSPQEVKPSVKGKTGCCEIF